MEKSVTNGRMYQRVPFTRVMGNRKALQQWLAFSEIRVYNPINILNNKDKTSLLPYLEHYFKGILPPTIMEMSRIKKEQNRMESLETEVA